ncbi:unnamed protein product [Durusdinium trenchii]|uniref:Major facilitator superfamily (MFS) profile domain-containing protein n=1 Tax=Durusdinium trenchii TaxID=1381693 RepID=A0ABP0LXJ6_9DINO
MGSSGLLSVYMAVLLDKMGAMMVLPLLPFIARSMDGTSIEVGLLQSLYSLMQVCGTLVLGSVADTWGKRRTLLLSLFSSSIFLLARGLAVSIWQLLLFRAGHGFFAGTVSICQAIVADVTPPEDRVGKMALIMAAYGVGVVLGPGLAGLIAPWGVFPVCAVASACTLCNFCIGWWQIPEIARPKEPEATPKEEAPPTKPVSALRGWRELLRALLSDMTLAAVCFLSFCQELGMGIFMGVSALFFQDRYGITASQLGLLFCAAGAGMVAFQGFVVSKFVKAVGRPISILCGWSLRLSIYLALASLDFAIIPWLSAVCVVAGGALIDPCAASLTSDKAPQGMSGIFLGAYQAAASIGSFMGPFLGGLLYDYVHTGPYWLASVASLLCLPAVLTLFRLQHSSEKGAAKEPLIAEEEDEEEQPIEKLLSEASPTRKRAIGRAAIGLRSIADVGPALSMFQLPLPELACRTLRHKDRISDESLGRTLRSKTEVFTPSVRERSMSLERILLRQYSMQASDRWSRRGDDPLRPGR